MSHSTWKFWKIRDDFDPDGQLDSIAPPARSNPTARRGRNHLKFFKIFMHTWVKLSALSMGQSIAYFKIFMKTGTDCQHSRWHIVQSPSSWKVRHHLKFPPKIFILTETELSCTRRWAILITTWSALKSADVPSFWRPKSAENDRRVVPSSLSYRTYSADPRDIWNREQNFYYVRIKLNAKSRVSLLRMCWWTHANKSECW